MASKLGLARAELPKLEGKEGFIARTRTQDETPISPAYVASPQYKFDPFETEAQKSVKIERASDEALAAFGVTRIADGLQFPFKKSSVEISDVYNTLGNNNPKGVFDNDNQNTFKDLNFSGTIKSIPSKVSKQNFSDKLDFGNAILSSMLTGSLPVGSAWSWIATGWQQRKDQEKFLQDFGKDGFSNLNNFKEGPANQYDMTWEYAQAYGDPIKKTARDFARDIFFNNPNPSKLIKDNMYGGKAYKGNAFDATKDFITKGLENGVLQENEIRQVADGYSTLKQGTAEWVKARIAKEALETKGWKIKGAVKISPTGEQFVHGEKWIPEEDGKKDFSDMFDKEPKVTTDDKDITPIIKPKPEPTVAKPEPTVAKPEPVIHSPHRDDGGGQQQNKQSSSSDQPVSRDTTSGKPTTGFGSWFSSAEGGRVQEKAYGDTVENDAGNLEMVNEQGKDNSGVADDVSRKLEEGDFVINAPASEMMGYSDISKMIEVAEQELATQGIKVDYKTPDGKINVKVSNKETIIPKLIAQQVGYDKLEKINNRGKKRVAELEKKKGQKGFIPERPEQKAESSRVQPQSMLAQTGGQVTLEENKNQPIAIPRESFAGMSSVGKRLLSPLSPEQQDREKELLELAKPSQSFEGFLKPIGMNKGDVVSNTADYDVDIISRMIMTEAFDSPEEWAAMAHVVLNREKDFGNYMPSSKGNTNIEKLILGENQFKGIVDNPEIFNNPQDTTLGKEKYKKVYQVVQNVLDGKIKDNTDGATYFDLQQKGAGQRIGKHWYHYGKETKYNPIIPTIKPKPQQTGMMAVN